MRKREDRYHNNQWTVKVEWRSQAVIALYPYIRPISSYIGNWVYTAGTTTPSPHHHHRLHPEGGVVGGAKLEARQLPGTLETVCVHFLPCRESSRNAEVQVATQARLIIHPASLWPRKAQELGCVYSSECTDQCQVREPACSRQSL